MFTASLFLLKAYHLMASIIAPTLSTSGLASTTEQNAVT